MKTLICDCNQTMPLDGPALRQALSRTPGAHTEGLETVHTLLCRREAGAFQRAAQSGEPLLVACTQESRLFTELHEATEGTRPLAERPIRFVNLRETGGWSADAAQAMPKLAALIAAAQLPDPEPVATVPYRSAGHCLVIGPAALVQAAAAQLDDKLSLSLLVTHTGGEIGQAHQHAQHAGQLTRLGGWLGAFEAEWVSSNPIDLDLCTRCNACVAACPEGAIGLDYQVNLDACRSHRDCVRVCEAAGAIDFQREPAATQARFDLVLDLRDTPAFTQHQPPQGYVHVGPGPERAQQTFAAVLQLRELVGEFDKPKFFRYQQSLCAHSRNQQIGCSACIEVCSAKAIRSDASLKGKTTGRGTAGQGGGIVVEPHLCVGCGACTTVCPSGALGYAYPGTVDQGRRIRTLLATSRQAGLNAPVLLLHSQGAGQVLVDALGRAASTQRQRRGAGQRATAAAVRGVPARVLPMAVWHTASVGLDLWLMAIAQGASQVLVLVTQEEAPDYRRALAEQMAQGQAMLAGLGYGSGHLRLIELPELAGGGTTSAISATPALPAPPAPPAMLAALDAALRPPPARGVGQPTTTVAQADKRATLALALDHLRSHAPNTRPSAPQAEAITLPTAGAAFGSLVIDTHKCTMCLSCVGACPASALADNPDAPQLKFTEKNCVQCGLCATTCPESAITLTPRLWLADEGRSRQATRVLHEVAPYACVRCAKPFGTLKAIEAMLGKLAGHPAFQGAAADRLKMCGDCRVIDLHSNPNETRITDL